VRGEQLSVRVPTNPATEPNRGRVTFPARLPRVARSIVARAKFVSRIDAAAYHALLKGAQGKGKQTDEHIARVQVCVESSRQKQPGILAKGKDAIIVVSGVPDCALTCVPR
jgi:hypothetical protein